MEEVVIERGYLFFYIYTVTHVVIQRFSIYSASTSACVLAIYWNACLVSRFHVGVVHSIVWKYPRQSQG